MPSLEPAGFTLLWVSLLIIFLFLNSFSSEVTLFPKLILCLMFLPVGVSSYDNLEISSKISSVAVI